EEEVEELVEENVLAAFVRDVLAQHDHSVRPVALGRLYSNSVTSSTFVRIFLYRRSRTIADFTRGCFARAARALVFNDCPPPVGSGNFSGSVSVRFGRVARQQGLRSY